MDPREHPDDVRRHTRPPDWNTFGNQTRFGSLRGFAVENGHIVGYREEIEKYVRTYGLGEILWPAYPMLLADNVGEVADEIKRQGLFLFDIWGYVPGSGPGDFWQQYSVPAGVLDLLQAKLGDHWLGMDVGEQDGRYIGGYASQMQPVSTNRFEQYLNFHRHFERMCDDLGNRVSALVSLNFGHYFLKEGIYTLIGAETAQGLPNGQVFYAFVRGAGKQYGVPWFGNASVFNRWNQYKTYGPPGPDHSPTMGTSLSLLRRLLYSHILYNSVFVGLESGWLEGEQLTPIGRIQQTARQWVAEHGQLGTMLTPTAVLIDFNAGWTFPRHLYTGDVYRVWGNLPYEAGDYLTDGVLDMLYPGYQDSSYYHDETGFLTPTSYGDCADCLLSDAEGWLLSRYAVLVAAGELTGGVELRDKLAAYVEAGGHLLLTAGNLAKFPGGLAGITVTGPAKRFPAGSTLTCGTETVVENQAFDLTPISVPSSARVDVRCDDLPAVVAVPVGRGMLTVFASPFGLAAQPVNDRPIASEVDKPLPKPFPLLAHVRAAFDRAFRSQCLFEAGEGLSVITCRRKPGEYTLGICNNAWAERPLKIVSHCGPIESVRELQIDQSAKSAVGYTATGLEQINVGVSGPDRIAGGDVLLLDVRLREDSTQPTAYVPPLPRPRGRILPLRGVRSMQEAILARPTFFEHFDGVLVDWAYLREREKEQLRREAGWLRRQKLRVLVDASTGVNLFPDLRLVNNLEQDYKTSLAVIDDILDKMQTISACDLLLSLHRVPENSFSPQQTEASFRETLRILCKHAETKGITIHLRMGLGKPPLNVGDADRLIHDVEAPNLRVAASTAVLIANQAALEPLKPLIDKDIGLWLAADLETDVTGKPWTAHGRLAGSPHQQQIARYLALDPTKPVVLDAVYRDQDEEYLDAQALAHMMVKSSTTQALSAVGP